jgi:hypothetical protein
MIFFFDICDSTYIVVRDYNWQDGHSCADGACKRPLFKPEQLLLCRVVVPRALGKHDHVRLLTL